MSLESATSSLMKSSDNTGRWMSLCLAVQPTGTQLIKRRCLCQACFKFSKYNRIIELLRVISAREHRLLSVLCQNPEPFHPRVLCKDFHVTARLHAPLVTCPLPAQYPPTPWL